jgi:hypothetical protein
MHEPISAFPKGVVVGSARLVKGDQVVDVTRLRYGSRTRFVEQVTHNSSYGPRVTAFRKSDDFPSDKIASRFICDWLSGIANNRDYKIIHLDAAFTADSATVKKIP